MDPTLQVQLEKLKVRLTQEGLTDILKTWDEGIWTRAGAITDPEKIADAVYAFSDANIEHMVQHEKDEVACTEALPRFNFDEILVDWLKQVPFFLEMSRWIRKRPATHTPNGMEMPTAAMCYNTETEDFEMLYNKRWFCGLKTKHGTDGVRQIEGVINHELDHFLFKHITVRRRDPMLPWNVATDAAINSLLVAAGMKLPKGGIVPGVRWEMPEGRRMTPEEKKMHDGLNDLVFGWPQKMASDWYFEELMKWTEENGYEWGKNGLKIPGQGGMGAGGEDGEMEIEGIDMHDLWDDIPEEQRVLVEEKLKGIIRRAVKHADNTQNGWGNIPSDMKELIRASVDDQIDWEEVLRNFIGMFTRGSRRTSIKKINKHYPYIHPGVKKGYRPHIAIGMDQSGSVSTQYVEAFFSVLGSLSKKVTFTVIPFDSSVDKDNIFEWKKGQHPEIKRTRSGGTSFDCITEYVNDPKHRGKWDGLVIMTDGECSDPGPSRVKRGWVICPNHKLMFPTDEMVIQMIESGKKIDRNSVTR